MAERDRGFMRIRIKESDHERITKRVTYEKKIYDVVTDALDALDNIGIAVPGGNIIRKSKSK